MKFSFPFSKCLGSASNTSETHHDEKTVHTIRLFSYNELKSATQGFSSSYKIGEGGFGSVYKGRLEDGSFVAVKVLSVEVESLRGEREFVSEIAALSVIKHENLVTLRGCCVDGANRLLVYSYVENNSLIHAFLGAEQTRMRFSWRLRKEICLGVARDFGLARLFRGNISHISTRVAGTLGYLSPEYVISGHFTRKSDIYSFGVLLLEIVTGGPIVTFDLESGEQFLVNKAWEMYKADQLLEVVDPLQERDFPAEETVRFLKIGLLCVQEAAALRPKMSTAIKMLLNNPMSEEDYVNISKPGILSDFRNVKIHSSTTMSPQTPFQPQIN